MIETQMGDGWCHSRSSVLFVLCVSCVGFKNVLNVFDVLLFKFGLKNWGEICLKNMSQSNRQSDSACVSKSCNLMLMCLLSPRGGEACGDQRHCQWGIMGHLPLVLVCWGRGFWSLFDWGYRCRDGCWVAEPHSAHHCPKPNHLWPHPRHLVQGQPVWAVQGGPLRPCLCRHHHRYQRRHCLDLTLFFASFFFCWTKLLFSIWTFKILSNDSQVLFLCLNNMKSVYEWSSVTWQFVYTWFSSFILSGETNFKHTTGSKTGGFHEGMWNRKTEHVQRRQMLNQRCVGLCMQLLFFPKILFQTDLVSFYVKELCLGSL